VNPYLSELFGLTGRTAVVTGGSSGIGYAIAEALGRAGARVTLLARGAPALERAAQSLRTNGCEVDWRSVDLGDRDALDRLADGLGERDILVNAAGINLRPPLPELTPQQWDRTMAVNLTAPYLLGQCLGPGMAARGWGRIVNILSQQAVRAYGNSGGYGAAKAGLAGLTRSQSEAWSRYGVCANAIAPGIIRTPMTAPLHTDPERWAALAARTHAGRNGEPADFAGAALFLCTNACGYVSGQTVFVDGGFSVA